MASAYFRYVSTEAITTRASTESSSMPTSDTLTQASITMPLSRIRSTTSAKLDESVDLLTFAMICSPFRLSSAGYRPHVMFDLPLLLQKRDQTRQHTISTVLSDRLEKSNLPAGSAGRSLLED